LLKEKLEDVQTKILKLVLAIETIPADDELAKERSLTASTIASDIWASLEEVHLIATSGSREPVPFEGMNPKSDKDEKTD
jgi:hypothetical protein